MRWRKLTAPRESIFLIELPDMPIFYSLFPYGYIKITYNFRTHLLKINYEL
jgi:hypothetical protein